MTVRIQIPIHLTNQTNERVHWRRRAEKAAAHRAAVRLAGGRLLASVRDADGWIVTLTRVSPRRLDSDGCAISFKAIRDEIADALGINDGSPRIGWLYRQRAGKPSHIEIEVRDCNRTEIHEDARG